MSQPKARLVGMPRFELMELGELLKRRWPKNAKRHDMEFLGEVFAENGMAEFPTLDEKTGKVVAGNGRVEKLAAMKAAGEPAPARIVVKKGKWYVPTVRGMSLAKPGKHVLASNRGVELGGWDNGLLADALGKLGEDDLGGTGFGTEDMVRFIKGEGAPQIPDMVATYSIIVECKNERQQTQLLKRFQAMALKVRALVS